MDKLIEAINISGTTYLIISKVDVLENVELYKFIFNGEIESFESIMNMKERINHLLNTNCDLISRIIYSNDPEYVVDLLNNNNEENKEKKE